MGAGSNAGVAGTVGVRAVNSASDASSTETVEALKSDLLMVYRAVIALEKRVNEYTVNMVEIKPQLIALKVHSESFPNAIREIRRGQTGIQRTVAGLEERLSNLEARIKKTSSVGST
jgi:chromosome segregation ATPase